MQKVPVEHLAPVKQNGSDNLENPLGALRKGKMPLIRKSKDESLKLCEIIDEDIEEIEIPDENTEGEELILPDDINSCKQSSTFFTTSNDNTFQRLTKLSIDVQKKNEQRNAKKNTITNKETSLDYKRRDYQTKYSNYKNMSDPLKCAESIPQHIRHRQENHDDDIEIIELCNSPICIESDNDNDYGEGSGRSSEGIVPHHNYLKQSINKQIITTATATVSLSKNITIRRTTAKKSTARTQSSLKTSNIEKYRNNNNTLTVLRQPTINTNYVKEFIEILDDSSDDDIIVVQPQLKKQKLLKTNVGKTKSFTQETSLPSVIMQSPYAEKQKSTPQSNFLNAVQLQPTINAFISSPNHITNTTNPDAFYGTPNDAPISPIANPNVMEQQEFYVHWLKYFIQLFCNPQFLASHYCFALLQRVLKYNDFLRIKTQRLNLKIHERQTAEQQIDWKLKADLTSILFKNENELTLNGQRFCEFTCRYKEKLSKVITLLTNANTGCIALKTGYVDHYMGDLIDNIKSKSMKNSTSKCKNYNVNNNDNDEDEYKPEISIQLQQHSNNSKVDIGLHHRKCKRLLRSKRAKRLDKNFSFNEDFLEVIINSNEEDIKNEVNEEEEVQTKGYKKIQRKVKNKRLEATLQRQQQVKSFENAFIQTIGKIDYYKTSNSSPTIITATGSYNSGKAENKTTDTERKRIRLNTNDALLFYEHYGATNDAEDLLQATWIENVDNSSTTNMMYDEHDSESNHNAKANYNKSWMEKYHRFHDHDNISAAKKPKRNTHLKCKQYHRKHFSKQNSNLHPSNSHQAKFREQGDEFISSNDFRNTVQGHRQRQNTWQFNSTDVNKEFPQNIDPTICYKNNCNKCVICKLNVQRIVNHYVNDHRGCEVYISRLNSTQLQQLQLQKDKVNLAEISLYKNGQYQYEAYCVFCQRQCRFLLLYWYQHFSMHTGEYAYRCNGCQMRRPTRSLLTQFHPKPCKNSMIVQDYQYDTTKTTIKANICTLCNYIQLHRENIIKHLQNQHNVVVVLSSHIKQATLFHAEISTISNIERLKLTLVPNKLNTTTSVNWNGEKKYYNESVSHVLPLDDMDDTHEDLSYMICGMLDVQIDD